VFERPEWYNLPLQNLVLFGFFYYCVVFILVFCSDDYLEAGGTMVAAVTYTAFWELELRGGSVDFPRHLPRDWPAVLGKASVWFPLK
jgi:hypothetical protein